MNDDDLNTLNEIADRCNLRYHTYRDKNELIKARQWQDIEFLVRIFIRYILRREHK